MGISYGLSALIILYRQPSKYAWTKALIYSVSLFTRNGRDYQRKTQNKPLCVVQSVLFCIDCFVAFVVRIAIFCAWLILFVVDVLHGPVPGMYIFYIYIHCVWPLQQIKLQNRWFITNYMLLCLTLFHQMIYWRAMLVPKYVCFCLYTLLLHGVIRWLRCLVFACSFDCCFLFLYFVWFVLRFAWHIGNGKFVI